MSGAWKQYRGAPAEGSILCRAEELLEGKVKSMKFGTAEFPILIVRSLGHVTAFVNACPHQYLPLDHRGDKMLSADGTIICCTNHGAGFRVVDGVGVEGLGLTCMLDAIPITVDAAGQIRVQFSSDDGRSR